jgi:hypothetical protein
MGEFFPMCPHVNVSLDRTHVPDFPLEALQNFRAISGTRRLLMMVPDEHNIGTERAQNWYRTRGLVDEMECGY